MARVIAIADSAGRAAEIAARGAAWMVGSYVGAQHQPVTNRPMLAANIDPVERYVKEVIIHGTPQAVRDQIADLRETAQLNYLLCAPLSQESFALLTDKVLPGLA
jgi:alkanesulfonate monooxygenase SsuD/methylene tetrahydromethanopterin reductase-like flavin-dependent oxidoreductase (luciferase family)